MIFAQNIFDELNDQTSTFSIADITTALVLSFVLSAIVGFVYRATHKGVSYSQSYVQTLVLMGMLVSLVMLVVGSNLARAFSLVGALSIVRFRNAVKETRDVGYIFFTMAIGMATGTRFYTLAAIATVVIALVMLIMDRFDMYRLDVRSQVVKVQVPTDTDYTEAIDNILNEHTSEQELVSAESIRGGALTEFLYTVKLRSGTRVPDLLKALQEATGGQKVQILTGYDRTDL